jgi:hypothetical protein
MRGVFQGAGGREQVKQGEIKVGHRYAIVERGKPMHVEVTKVTQRIVLGSRGSPRNKFTGFLIPSGRVIEFSCARVRYEVGAENS